MVYFYRFNAPNGRFFCLLTITVFLCFLVSRESTLLYAQQLQQQQNNLVPSDFPKYKDTGNSQADNERYNTAKANWIAANKTSYENIVKQQATPAAKTAQTTEAPVAPKAAMIPPYDPSKQQTSPNIASTATQDLPTETPIQPNDPIQQFADFPKYIDTGNAQADNARYDAAKKAWIAAHPQEYINLNQAGAPKKHIIDKQELERMPLDKRQQIVQNPDLFIIWDRKILDVYKIPK